MRVCYLSCSSSSVVFLGPRISSRTGSSQQSPAPWLRLAPSATPWCFPISDARRVYLVDSFIALGSQPNAHTTSPVSHLLRSHLQWLASCFDLTVEGRRQAFTSLLLVHKFNRLTSCCHGASTDWLKAEYRTRYKHKHYLSRNPLKAKSTSISTVPGKRHILTKS